MANPFYARAKQEANPFKQRAAISKALTDQAAGAPAPQGPTEDFTVPSEMVPQGARIQKSVRKALDSMEPQEPEPQGTLRGDLYHAIGRGGLKAVATVPGTLATLMEAGGRAPGSWGNWGVPGTSEERAKTIRNLRRKARDIYKLSEAEVLRAKRGGAGGVLVNLVGESIPQFGMSAVAAMLGGPAAVVATSAAMGGEEVYQNLRDLGVDHDKANAARWVTAPIIGLVEKWQMKGILKLGNKKAVKELVSAARDRAFKKMARAGVDITFDEAMNATVDGLQEVIQEGVVVGAEIATGRELDLKEDLIRLGGAGVGGAIVGESLRGGASLARGGSSVLAEVEKQHDVGVSERMVVEQELQPPTAGEPVQPTAPEIGPGGEGFTPTVTEGMPESPGVAEPAPEAPKPEIVAPVGSEPGSSTADVVAEPPIVQPEGGEDPERPYMATRNADMETRSGWMGNPPVPEQIPAGTLQGRRQAAIDGGYDQRAPDIANDILNDPRPATSEETHGLDIRAEQLEGEHSQMAEQLDAMPEDDPNRDTVMRRMGELEEQHAVIAKVLRWAGTEWSAAGFARQHRLGDNGNVLNVIGRATKAAGKPLDADTKQGLHKKSRKLNRKRKRARAATQKDARNHMRRAMKQAGSRYSKMSDVDKDAELADLLTREHTDLIIYKVMLNIASRMEGADLEAVTRKVLGYFPDLTAMTLTDAVVRATDRRAQNTDAMAEYLRAMRRRYRKVKGLRTDIDEVLYWMREGRMPDEAEPTPGEVPDKAVQYLENILRDLKAIQSKSEAAEQQRIERRIAFLKARLAAKDFDTTKRAKLNKPSRRTLQLQYEMARLDAEIAREINKQKPVSKLRHIAAETARTVMALKSSFDLSALGNQGGWVLLSHPIRALRTLPKALRAAASDKTAYETNQAIRNRPNAPYYFRDGLELTDASRAGNFTEKEELFRSNWIGAMADSKIPGLRQIGRGVMASDRAFATTLNLLRADSYDSMAASFADEGGPTETEGRAIADFINMATGRGVARGGTKELMNRMNGIFWAPRRALSRFQMLATLGGQLEYRGNRLIPVGLRGSRRVRRMFAVELGRYLAGLATVYFLGQLAGGELEWDTRSSDAGKIRFGNTRLDPLSGMAQTLTIVGRMALKERKDQEGNITPLTGYDLERTVAQFLKNKVSPALNIAWAGYTGDTPFSGATTPLWVAKEAVTPIALDDIYEVMRDQGVPRGTILSMLGILGIGVQVYGDTTTSTRSRGGAL
ncbi:MAG: hypothetical protein GY832_31555 [Chloroflexi bacterium]|nr:hypothetical protein [Chloroflexota bacterium]